jgi:hypothetical protein
VVGAYSIVFCIGLYLRCSIPYIIINAIKKAVVPGFVMAVVTVPFQLFGEYSRISPIIHYFSSVAYVWVPGAKTTGPIVNKFGFS